MTLTELMISLAITGLASLALVSLQFLSARSITELYGQTRTRSSRMVAIDQIRYRLCEARVGSIVVTQDNHHIEFIDPNLGGVTSAFHFDENTATLTYDDDISDGDAANEVVEGPIDITFELQSAGAIVMLKVKSSAAMAHGDVDLQDGETVVYVRNT